MNAKRCLGSVAKEANCHIENVYARTGRCIFLSLASCKKCECLELTEDVIIIIEDLGLIQTAHAD